MLCLSVLSILLPLLTPPQLLDEWHGDAMAGGGRLFDFLFSTAGK